MNLGFGIKKIREECGITQVDLADMADISQAYLSQIECGKRNFSMEIANNIMKQLPVPNIRIIYASIQIEDIELMKRDTYKVLKPILESVLKEII